MKKDKQKVIGETFTDEMLVAYLEYQPNVKDQVEFDRLLRAYRGLPEAAFARYIKLYQAKGYDLNPSDRTGQHFLDLIRRFESFPGYVTLIEQALEHEQKAE